MNTPLRSPNGQLLGTLHQENGYTILRDKHNNKLGAYNPRTNDTRDANGRLIGRGDLLGTLLRS